MWTDEEYEQMHNRCLRAELDLKEAREKIAQQDALAAHLEGKIATIGALSAQAVERARLARDRAREEASQLRSQAPLKAMEPFVEQAEASLEAYQLSLQITRAVAELWEFEHRQAHNRAEEAVRRLQQALGRNDRLEQALRERNEELAAHDQALRKVYDVMKAGEWSRLGGLLPMIENTIWPQGGPDDPE